MKYHEKHIAHSEIEQRHAALHNEHQAVKGELVAHKQAIKHHEERNNILIRENTNLSKVKGLFDQVADVISRDERVLEREGGGGSYVVEEVVGRGGGGGFGGSPQPGNGFNFSNFKVPGDFTPPK